MRRYRMPTGLVRPCQPNTSLEKRLKVRGAQLVEDDDHELLVELFPQGAPSELADLTREQRWDLADWARALQAAEGIEPVGGEPDNDDPLTRQNWGEIEPLVDDFDFDTLEHLIRNETEGGNRRAVLAGLERLKKNAPGAPATEKQVEGPPQP